MKKIFAIILFIICLIFLCACANKGPAPSPTYSQTAAPTIPYATPVEPVYPDSSPPVLTSNQIPPSPKPR